MATLHVRNVPDGLYEQLRATAAREGRSIGQQAIVLLGAALRGRGRLEEVEVIRPRTPFLRRFAETAEEIVLRAQAHARSLGAPEVLPSHVMLAMLEDDALRPTLERRGVTVESVRAVLQPAEPRQGAVPIAAETRQLLERVLLAALSAA